MKTKDLIKKMNPKNPRIHPVKSIEKLVRSVEEFGWTNPILLAKDGYVIAGHARLKAAEKSKLKEVPVIQTDLAGAKADAYMIADNKLQEETAWDIIALKDLLGDLDTGEFDVELTGFDTDQLELLFTEYQEPGSEFWDEDNTTPDDKKGMVTCPECGHEFKA